MPIILTDAADVSLVYVYCTSIRVIKFSVKCIINDRPMN